MRVVVRVAGRDRLGYRRHGTSPNLREQIGRAFGVPAFIAAPARRRTLRQIAARRRQQRRTRR